MNFFIILLTILILLTCTTNVCMYYLISKPQGVTGISGDKGKKGLPGQQGDMGPRGFKGETGDVGSKGPSQGLIGKKGPKGITGTRGPPGEVGFEGLRGYTGGKGPPGLQGDQGPPGKKGRVGTKGPSRIFPSNEDIPLMALKDKCITIKNIGNNNPEKFTCPNNMVVFDFKGSKISEFGVDMKIEDVTCCNFGLYNPTLVSVYSRIEMLTPLITTTAELKREYLNIPEDSRTEDDIKILNNLNIISTILQKTDNVDKEFLYPLRLLFELRNDKSKFINEIKKFPKNNIMALENYLKIE